MNDSLAQLRWAHFSKEMTPQWSELTHLVAKADGHDEIYSPEDLAEELDAADFDPESQSFAVWNDKRLIATAEVSARLEPRFDGLGQAGFEINVLPEWRGRGLEAELFDRCEEVGRTLVEQRTPDADYVMSTRDRAHDPVKQELLTERGYRLTRIFHEMHRPLPGTGEELADRSHPVVGVSVRSVELNDSEAIRLAHNDAFRQHWGAGPRGLTEWKELMESRTTRLAQSRIAVDQATGEVLAYAIVSQWSPHDLYVLLVGTRRDHQNRGLGKAVLSEVLRAADREAQAGSGLSRIDLDVDSDSPTNAGRLYTSLGFTTVRTDNRYQKLIRARDKGEA